MKSEDDDALREALAAAHAGDAARTPPVQRVLARGRASRRTDSPLPWLVTCLSLGAALGLAAWLVGRLGPPPAQLPQGTQWSFPTDFLLETPGSVTLRSVPELGPKAGDFPLEPGTRRGNP